MPRITAENAYSILPDLIPQLVNRNGSSKEALLDQYKKCLSALRVLEEAMGEAMPHGRDYQTHSNPDASIEARQSWGHRRMWLHNLHRDLQHSAEMIYGQ